MQGLLAHGAVSREATLALDIDAVFERRGAQHAELRREIVGEMIDDDRVAADREVQPVLLARPDRDDQPRVLGEYRGDVTGVHFLEPARYGRWERVSHSGTR